MRILFFCGCLEPGCDGVGDYTRRLAGELKRKGNSVAIISLNDYFISGIQSEEQEQERTYVPVLRLGSDLPFRKKIGRAKKWVKEFDPTWLSLQYVPFSFHDKGLPLGLGKQLSTLGKGKTWHIMFHELWVGMDVESSWKHKLWGRMQAYIAQRLIKKLSPKVIHTQARLYQNQLQNFGYKIDLLPLFGNIPVSSPRELGGKRKTILSLVVFGQIQPGAPISQFAEDLVSYEKFSGKTVRLTFLGRLGSELDNWLNACRKENLTIELLGEQSSKKISEVFSRSDWGISSTPAFQIEKSGTVAAMREHNLPVYCVARPWHTQENQFDRPPYGVRIYKPSHLDLSNGFQFENKRNRLSQISNLFFESLS